MISSGWAFWSGGLVALVLAFVCRWAVLYTRRQINVPVVKSDSPSQTDPWTFKKLLQKGYERVSLSQSPMLMHHFLTLCSTRIERF